MGNTVQIHFFGPITIQSAETFRNMLLNSLATPNIEGIEILMSSEGGDLNSGFTMYNYLRSYPLRTSIVNMGAIESIALIPYLGANERRAAANARFMIHNFHWNFQNGAVDINRVSEYSHSLQIDVERFIEIYDERTAEAAVEPLDVRQHLTAAPAMIIGKASARKAGILTTDDFDFPSLGVTKFF